MNTLMRYPNAQTMNYYQDLGFDRNSIIQAWNKCQGNEHLLLDILLSHSGKYPYIKRIPNSTLLKKLPRTHHLRLKFQGNTALEYIELRKLGLFSKRVFRNIKRFSLEYEGFYYQPGYGILRKKHVLLLASHINRSLRKLKHLSIKLGEMTGPPVEIQPLLKSLKETFLSLVSLKLSLDWTFSFSREGASGFERLFARIGSTLKHLDINFRGRYEIERDFPEAFTMAILKNLGKLETLRLYFYTGRTSAVIIRLLLWGACTHLTRLKSLDLYPDFCKIDAKDWEFSPKSTLTSRLQCLKLTLPDCSGLSMQFLSTLQNDIVVLCPKLEELEISTIYCTKFPFEFYESFEKGFLQRLNLKKFRIHYGNESDYEWASYQNMQALEHAQMMALEEEEMKLQEKLQEQEEGEMQLYNQGVMEEEFQGRVEFEEEVNGHFTDETNLEYGESDNDYYEVGEEDLYDMMKHEMEEEEKLLDAAEAEIRRTQGDLIPGRNLDFGDF